MTNFSRVTAPLRNVTITGIMLIGLYAMLIGLTTDNRHLSREIERYILDARIERDEASVFFLTQKIADADAQHLPSNAQYHERILTTTASLVEFRKQRARLEQ
jgi:hypothetical protein